MELTISTCVIFVPLMLVFLLFVGFYWNILRKCKGFPVNHLIVHAISYNLRNQKSSFANFIFQKVMEMCQKNAKEGLCMAYSHHPVLFIFGAEEVNTFLNHKATADKAVEYRIISDFLGSGLVTSSGDRWKKHRRLINPAFHLGILKEKVPLFNQHALALVEDLRRLDGKPSTDLIDIIKCHVFNALCESVFGLKQNEENKTALLKYFKLVKSVSSMAMYRTFHPWLRWKFMLNLLPSGKQYLSHYNELNNFMENVITEMKKYDVSSKISDDTEYFSKYWDKSFTYLLLQHHSNDPTFTFEDLHAEVKTFMVGGFDTTSYALMWCLFMLSLHPEIQEKAFQEVKNASDEYITYEETTSYTYLEAIIMETLRLYPVIPFIARRLNEDVHYKKYKVLRGTSLVFVLYYYHRDPHIYKDADKFDPERFLNADQEKPPTSAFAEGNRMCIGKKYALIEMKIYLAHILRNFRIHSLDKIEDVKLCWNIVLYPAKRLHIFLTPRTVTSSSNEINHVDLFDSMNLKNFQTQ